jgi:hypothetical protein
MGLLINDSSSNSEAKDNAAINAAIIAVAFPAIGYITNAVSMVTEAIKCGVKIDRAERNPSH